MNHTAVGVDIAKRVFQVHWVDPRTGDARAIWMATQIPSKPVAVKTEALLHHAPRARIGDRPGRAAY